MRRVVVTHSPKETENLGRWLGVRLRRGDILCLIGDLGSGKTCLTRGVAAGLGADPDLVVSPTFLLVAEYPLPRVSSEEPHTLYHVDLYRLNSPEEFEDIGGEEMFAAGGVCVVEWADRLGSRLPQEALRLYMTMCGVMSRRMVLEGDEGRFPWLAAWEEITCVF